MLALTAGPARAASAPDAVAAALAGGDVHVDGEVDALVDRERLSYAAGVASRAAGGAPMKVVFANVPDEDLDDYRDALFERLDLGERGAVVIATPVSITMRTSSLQPRAEAAILGAHAPAFRRVPRRYTEPLAELVYDVGLVVHNSTPGVQPRGAGPDADLRTFTGSFPGEGGARWWIPAAAATALAALLAAVRLRRHRPR